MESSNNGTSVTASPDPRFQRIEDLKDQYRQSEEQAFKLTQELKTWIKLVSDFTSEQIETATEDWLDYSEGAFSLTSQGLPCIEAAEAVERLRYIKDEQPKMRDCEMETEDLKRAILWATEMDVD
jgi:hypothetical protein